MKYHCIGVDSSSAGTVLALCVIHTLAIKRGDKNFAMDFRRITTAKDLIKARNAGNELLFILIDRTSSCDSLVSSLESKGKPWTVKEVRFCFIQSEGSCPKQFLALLQSVATCFASSLERAWFMASSGHDNGPYKLWPSSLISNFFEHTRHYLKEIKFFSSGIRCKNNTRLQELYRSIAGMTILESFDLGATFSLYIGTDWDHLRRVHDLTPLLSNLPNVKHIAIRLNSSQSVGSKRSTDFRPLFQKTSLNSLEISKLQPADTYAMHDLAAGLSASLQEFRELKIKFKWFTDFILEEDPTGPHWSSLKLLAEAIGTSTSLTKVDIDFDYSEYESNVPITKLDQFMLHLAATIAENTATKLKSLTIGPCPEYFDQGISGKDIWQAYIDLLEFNTTLENLHIDQDYELLCYVSELEGYELDDKMRMYLKLNKHGRGRLLKDLNSVSLEEWTDVLKKLQNDYNPACVNYYLALFPWLENTGFKITEERTW